VVVQVKWRLMVTSCYRRLGNYSKALELYEEIHAEHPDNVECLKYLVALCKDLGRPYDQVGVDKDAQCDQPPKGHRSAL
jgi:intraflagellar transport protein 88